MFESRDPSSEAKWPLTSLLLIGTFGRNSPGGERYHRRCIVAAVLALVAVVAAWVALRYVPEPLQSAIDVVAVYYVIAGTTFTYVAWAFWQYLGDLDELSRRIQLEAIALSYLTGLGAFSFLAAVGYQTHWTIAPLWFIFLEGVRGCWLWRLARRY